LIRAMAPIRIDSPDYGMRIAILLGAALAIAPTSALAEVQVHGGSEAVTIQAHDISVEEVLAALSRTFDMDYQSAIDLDKRLNGTYVGALSRVVTRILQGYNFVLKTDNGSIFVTVVGTPSLAVNPAPQGLPASSAPRAPAPEPRQSGVPAPVPRGLATTPGAESGSSAPVTGSKL
jgi:hypothetical protein